MFKFSTHKEAQATMNYNLNKIAAGQAKKSGAAGVRQLWPILREERKSLYLALTAISITSILNLAAPIVVGHTIDKYVQTKQYHGVLVFSGVLLAMYCMAGTTAYLQTKLMGGVGQRTLFNLRNKVFNKLQDLPVAFFNQNKAGDLISRINNDTDKVNQFFSQSLMQFIGNIFTMIGAGIFLLSINLKLGAAALAPALLLFIFTKVMSPWIKKKNAVNLKSVGNLSAEIQESLSNFKVIIAFNRRDYFRNKFEEANKQNYTTAIGAGVANNTFIPVYGFLSNWGQLIVLAFGIYLISAGEFSVGLLISFLAYINNFYFPLRQLAALWSNFQVAMAGWDRISQILALQSDLVTVKDESNATSQALLEFRNVSFGYPISGEAGKEGMKEVLHNINFALDKGKTYALVGPTGGGKTTAASLIARLYDPIAGTVFLAGKDLRTYTPEERTAKIGFILQEPFLFSGTVRDNILYGNEKYKDISNEKLEEVIHSANLERLLEKFEQGLDTPLQATGDGVSLGQKQLIAFIRVVLRDPDLLILDEATANIDTVTEKLLDDILTKLPAHTTKVIIAHRLNTIENADEIYFVNSGEVIKAGSLNDAMNMLLKKERVS